MNNHRTTTILQRAPIVLAVTAASYGLPPLVQGRPTRNKKPPAGGWSSHAGRFNYMSQVRGSTA